MNALIESIQEQGILSPLSDQKNTADEYETGAIYLFVSVKAEDKRSPLP